MRADESKLLTEERFFKIVLFLQLQKKYYFFGILGAGGGVLQ